MKKILVAEDEDTIREFIVINLKRSGYTVTDVDNGTDALKAYESTSDFDIALLDVMMPGMDGITLCRKLRALSESMGIILLTAKTQEIDKIGGLMSGADDYITKPFSLSELMARVDALYRRVALRDEKNKQAFCTELKSGGFVLNLRSRSLSFNNELIDLTQVEFQIMEYFFNNAGTALSRKEILEHVWGEEYFGEEKIVDVNIRRLRMKIEEQPSAPRHIITIWGYGYKWEA